MSEERPPKKQYALYRLRGYGANRAAEKAGYSGARPSPDARELWDQVQRMRGCDTGAKMVKLRKRVTRLEYELDRASRRLRAVQVLRDAEKLPEQAET